MRSAPMSSVLPAIGAGVSIGAVFGGPVGAIVGGVVGMFAGVVGDAEGDDYTTYHNLPTDLEGQEPSPGATDLTSLSQASQKRREAARDLARQASVMRHSAHRQARLEKRAATSQTREGEARTAAYHSLEAATEGLVSIGAVVRTDPYRSRGASGRNYDFGGYNVEPYTYLPWEGNFTPLGKFDDNPFGEQKVGRAGRVGRLVIGRAR